MDDIFEVGSILQYEDDSIGKVVVLGNYAKDDSIYSLVCPIDEGREDNSELNLSKCLVLDRAKDGEIYVETDIDIISETISHIL